MAARASTTSSGRGPSSIAPFSLLVDFIALALLLLLVIYLSEQLKNAKQKLTLVSGQVFSHLVKYRFRFRSAVLTQIATQLNLVNALHFVSLA